MTRIITPGLFLAAVMSFSACTDGEDDPAPAPDEPDVAACCANETPHVGEPLTETFDLGRRAHDRLDLLRRWNLRR